MPATEVTKVHVYVVTFAETTVVVLDVQLDTGTLFGSEIDQVTAPVGWTPVAIPETVVVKVVVPFSVGFAEAARVIIGVCSARLTVN